MGFPMVFPLVTGNPSPAASLVRGVLHIHLLKDAQLSDSEGQAGQEGQQVGLRSGWWSGDLWNFLHPLEDDLMVMLVYL